MTWEEGGQGDDEDEEGDDEEEARERREMEEEEHEEREGRPDNLTLGAEGSLCVCVCVCACHHPLRNILSVSLYSRPHPAESDQCGKTIAGGTWEEQVANQNHHGDMGGHGRSR